MRGMMRRILHIVDSRFAMPPRATLLPRKLPSQDRSRATVEAILTGAAQVLVREGYARMTTTRVAEVAGVSVGSLYQYFPSKQALARAVVERTSRELAGAMSTAAAAAAAAPLEEKVTAVIRALLAAKHEKRSLTRVLDTEIPRTHGFDIVEEVARQARALVRSMIEAHRAEVRVADPELAAFMVVASVEGVVRTAALDPSRRLDDPDLERAIVSLVLAYLRAPATAVRRRRR
jgi:AcrR family transcriptional regulator